MIYGRPESIAGSPTDWSTSAVSSAAAGGCWYSHLPAPPGLLPAPWTRSSQLKLQRAPHGALCAEAGLQAPSCTHACSGEEAQRSQLRASRATLVRNNDESHMADALDGPMYVLPLKGSAPRAEFVLLLLLCAFAVPA